MIEGKYTLALRVILGTMDGYCLSHRRKMRGYQKEVMVSVMDMLQGKGGRSMAVMFPARAGKTSCRRTSRPTC